MFYLFEHKLSVGLGLLVKFNPLFSTVCLSVLNDLSFLQPQTCVDTMTAVILADNLVKYRTLLYGTLVTKLLITWVHT